MDAHNILLISNQERDWLTERSHWTIYYDHYLQDKLAWAISYILQNRSQPQKLAPHIDSLFVLLDQAYFKSHLSSLVMELIIHLHPWPTRWGRWDVWEEKIRYVNDIAIKLEKPDRQVEFQTYLAELWFYIGRMQEALDLGKQTILLARANQSILPLVMTASKMIVMLRNFGRVEEARGLFIEIENDPLVQNVTEVLKTVINAHLSLPRTVLLRGEGYIDDAISEANQAIAQVALLSNIDAHLQAELYRHRGLMLWSQGNYALAKQDLYQAMNVFAHEGDIFAEAQALSNLGLVYWSMAEFDEAKSTLQASIKIFERLNAYLQLTRAIGNLGLVYLSQGKLPQALDFIERHLKLAIQLGDESERSRALANRGMVKLHQDEYEAARIDLEVDLAFLKKGEPKQEGIGCTYVNLSWCYAKLGQQENALQAAEYALALGKEIGSIPLQIISSRCLAEYQLPLQRAALLRQTLDLSRHHQRRLDEAACLLSLASLTKDITEQNSLWEKGTLLLKEIGAIIWVKGCSPLNPPHLPAII